MESLNIVMKNTLKSDEESINQFINKFACMRNIDVNEIDNEGGVRYYVNFNNTPFIGPSLSIFFDDTNLEPYTLMLDVNNKIFYGNSSEISIRTFDSLIQDAIALMQISNNQYFVGGREVFETGPGESRYTIFFFKGNEHIKFLKKHLFEIFKLDLEEKEIKDYVEKYADINEDYPDDYHLICFYPYKSHNEPKNFYNQIEKLKNE